MYALQIFKKNLFDFVKAWKMHHNTMNINKLRNLDMVATPSWSPAQILLLLLLLLLLLKVGFMSLKVIVCLVSYKALWFCPEKWKPREI